MTKKLAILFAITTLIVSCGEVKEEEPQKPSKPNKVNDPKDTLDPTPIFVGDSAYKFVDEQVAFGPRVPNSEEHGKCKDYLVKKLKSYGFNVIEQDGQAKAFTGDILNFTNIIGEHLPEAKERILLCAHWDTRPFADKDSVDQLKPIDGANDGASGVGVLLEIARQISIKSPGYGVDIIFFDAEDYGSLDLADYTDMAAMQNDWCLGSQYWSINPHVPDYDANYGILLDMVGAEDATFPKEGLSMQYAKTKVNKLWKFAKTKGYSKTFVHNLASGITDDHAYINQYAGIPTLDIIDMKPGQQGIYHRFGTFHHTHADNMTVISKKTLQKVGEVVMEAVYQKL